ncbi:Hypothetical predicted protein [Pelobates cultripes]|uniref:Uncharacterized protein n=1 Tax=Pelobates cultripes TaxID=61616 RepID=A0AAD1W6X6_PELCU|nr:Hypothetical predicted protein [Pelobates cultripes]
MAALGSRKSSFLKVLPACTSPSVSSGLLPGYGKLNVLDPECEIPVPARSSVINPSTAIIIINPMHPIIINPPLLVLQPSTATYINPMHPIINPPLPYINPAPHYY